MVIICLLPVSSCILQFDKICLGLDIYERLPAYSGAVDIMLALLPCKIFWPLMMRRKEKIGITIAMGMGVL